MARCSGKTKSGERCRANAGPSGKCVMHAHRNRARDLARKSVEAKRKAKEAACGQLVAKAPHTPEDLIRELAAAFAELKNGKLDENLARALATVGNSILKGFEVVDVKKQLAEIERLLKERV